MATVGSSGCVCLIDGPSRPKYYTELASLVKYNVPFSNFCHILSASCCIYWLGSVIP